uniref:Selenocysteine lyase n=1 Tax=Syphacia muris TaxID=451379 RepID=A0A0N5AAY1_9BILA
MWYIEEQEKVYLDYSATTPLDLEVVKAINIGLKYWANPSSSNPLGDTLGGKEKEGGEEEEGKKAKEAVEKARVELADLFHVTPREVFFTSGGTETNYWVIHSAIEHYKAQHGREAKPHLISSGIEHPSLLEPLHDLQNKNVIDLTEINIDAKTGCVKLDELQAAINERTCLITVMLCNNETGVVQPLSEVATIARSQAESRYDIRILVHTDGAQAVGKMDIDLNELKVDFLTVVGHKFYGPRIGALILRSATTVPLISLFFGGGQEMNKRAGTENTPMIMGLGAAARVIANDLDSYIKSMEDIRNYFERRLKEVFKDGIVINFEKSNRAPHLSSVGFIKYEGTAVELLSKCSSFIASTGAACHSSGKKCSSVLINCGLSEQLASRTVRFSFGRQTKQSDVDRVISELSSIVFLSKYGSSLLKTFSKGPVPGF